MPQKENLELLGVTDELSKWRHNILVGGLPELVVVGADGASLETISIDWVPIDEQVLDRAVIS